MTRTASCVALALLMVVTGSAVRAAEKAPQEVLDLVDSELASIASDPVLIAAVKTENAKGKSLEEIQQHDELWRSTAGVADFMRELMESASGKRLREIQQSQDYFAEIFVMDDKGATVAETNKTSDYWQGDEAKFTESIKGSVHISDVEFDDSAQAYVVQVSLPVKDGERIIGAVTFGIDIDALLGQ